MQIMGMSEVLCHIEEVCEVVRVGVESVQIEDVSEGIVSY